MPFPTALLWDFDGTLADTRQRNFNVVRRLFGENLKRPLDGIPALTSAESYDRVNRRYFNWRELYATEFGFDEGETDRLGRMWAEYQTSDVTPVQIFDGIGDVLASLRHARHGVVSQNARGQIERTLADARLQQHFGAVVGYDDVPLTCQKPAPDCVLACLEQLAAFAPGSVMYVGDHETDVRCARNAQRALADRGVALQVVSVAACFVGDIGLDGWTHQPDHVARSPREVAEIAERLA
jgi:HAD superfamily hydrolase (TIGR01549 family)